MEQGKCIVVYSASFVICSTPANIRLYYGNICSVCLIILVNNASTYQHQTSWLE